MKLSFKRQINLGFGLALLILGFINVGFYLNTSSLAQLTDGVSQTHRALEILDQTSLNLSLTDAGRRKITDSPEPTSAYAIKASVTEAMTGLRILLSGNPDQMRRIEELESAINL